MNSPAGARVESALLTVLVQLIVIIAAARIFGAIFRRYLDDIIVLTSAAALANGKDKSDIYRFAST